MPSRAHHVDGTSQTIPVESALGYAQPDRQPPTTAPRAPTKDHKAQAVDGAHSRSAGTNHHRYYADPLHAATNMTLRRNYFGEYARVNFPQRR